MTSRCRARTTRSSPCSPSSTPTGARAASPPGRTSSLCSSELTLDPDRWPLFPDGAASPHADAKTSELLGAVRHAVARELTPHQREVLVAVTLDDVPIDVLAERLGSTRNALYKTLHDARRKLRARLALDGLEPRIDGRGGRR